MHRDEFYNALTHGAGLLASAAGGAALITLSALRSDIWILVATIIFVTTLVVLYAASTAYHLAVSPTARARLKVFDHCAIYLLIAGTYTPFLLGPVRGPVGWSLFGVVWGLALAGVVFKLFFTGRFAVLSTATYVAMGWLVLVAARPLVEQLSTATIIWLVAGGVTYTAGTFFYHRPRLRYAHPVWHLFVLGGSVCHAAAVATLIL
jgi:hemolysin III